jgi:hypothetical protein
MTFTQGEFLLNLRRTGQARWRSQRTPDSLVKKGWIEYQSGGRSQYKLTLEGRIALATDEEKRSKSKLAKAQTDYNFKVSHLKNLIEKRT